MKQPAPAETGGPSLRSPAGQFGGGGLPTTASADRRAASGGVADDAYGCSKSPYARLTTA